MVPHLARGWWLVALRGVISIAFGCATFVWPGMTLFVLIVVFGAYMLVDGIAALSQAFRFRHERERWPMLVIEGVLGLAVGLATLTLPAIAALAWVYTVAGWAIVTGILEILLAVRLRREIENEIFVALTGALSIGLGVILILLPVAGLLVWAYTVGAYAIVFGALLLALAFRLRRAGGAASAPA